MSRPFKYKLYTRLWARFLRLWLSVPEVSRRMNIPLSTIKLWAPANKQYGKKWAIAIPLLGTLDDAAVGRKSGLTRSAIWIKRNELGIPKYRRQLKPRSIAEKVRIEKESAENQVMQELMNSWKAP